MLLVICIIVYYSLTAIQEVPGLIPGYTLGIFLELQGLERGPPSLARTTGQVLDMRGNEIRLRKLKLRLRDKCFVNHKAPWTAIWQQQLQSVFVLRGCSATDLFSILQQPIMILHYSTLCYIILYYIALNYITLYYTILHYTILYYITLHYTKLYYIALQYTILHCVALHCIAMHCIMGRSVIGIFGSLIWSKTLMELILTCGEFL